MYERLEQFLGKNTSDIKRGVVMAGIYILEEYGLVSAWSEIAQMLETSNNVDTAQLVLDVEVIVNQGVNNVLAQHQIKAEGNLGIKIDILESLKILMDYEDSATIIQFCDLDDDPTQTLCDLMELVSNRTWGEYADVLKEVSGSLIRKLADIHRAKGEAEDLEQSFRVEPQRKEALVKHINTYLVSLTKRALAEDMTMIGTPFKMIIHRYNDEITSLQPMAAKQAAIELVGLSLISDTSLSDFTRQVKDQIEEIYSDTNFITQVDMEIDNVIKEVMGRG